MGVYKPSGGLSPKNETAGSWVWNFSNVRAVRNTFLMLRSLSLWSSAAPAPGHSTAASVVPLGRGCSGRVWAPWSTGLICFSSCLNSKFPAIPLLKDELFRLCLHGTSGSGAGWSWGKVLLSMWNACVGSAAPRPAQSWCGRSWLIDGPESPTRQAAVSPVALSYGDGFQFESLSLDCR